MGGRNSVVNPIGKNFLGTGGTALNRPLSAFGTGGLSEFTQKNPFGIPGNPLASVFGNDSNKNPYVSGPFSLDPNQVAGDRGAINALGESQYKDTLSAIDTNAAEQQKFAGESVNRMLPGVYEDLNARHLLNSSALPTEIARLATDASQDVASRASEAKLAALTGRQGFETGALQRGLSLEDFVNSANVSKSIGAAFQPQPQNGKQNFGTVAQGVGALAPIARMAIK